MKLPLYLASVLGVSVVALFLQPARSENCTMMDTCMCNTSKGIINLTPLSSDDASPRFTNLIGPKNDTYSYNPCKIFSKGDCVNAYICERDESQTQERIIADSDEVIHGHDDNTFTVSYKSSSDLVKSVEVKLVCDQSKGLTSSRVIALGDAQQPFNYRFELHSCQVCLNGCQESAGTVAGIIGLVIIILFILAVISYFIIGAVIMKVRYQATGSDLVPNKDFWASLPFLVKDGCLFVVSPCYKNKDGYSNL